MATQLETTMASLMEIFDKYAGTDGNPDTLSNKEVKTLLEKELPGLLEAAKDKGEVDKMFQELESNGEAEVDFSGFALTVACLTCVCRERILKK